ncbi:MAG TPA: hypothetical protein VK598_02330 [Nitrospiraceae bacterium]|nr:hypothetical protein [Nitrospiraceae bacterium]
MKGILITVPDPIKEKLDLKRLEGYSLNGWINALLKRALADPLPVPRRRKGRRATP